MPDVTLTGVKELVAALDAKPRQVRAATAEGLGRFGTAIMNMAKEHYVPVETGALRGSGQVRPTDRHGDTVSVELMFGGAAAGYAVYVHEIPARHPHGQMKYLEAPLKLMGTQAGVDHFLAKPIREALERGAAR